MKGLATFEHIFNTQNKKWKIIQWFNQLTYPSCIIWHKNVSENKSVSLNIFLMTCTALPKFCLALFSLFPMTSLLKLHIGYKLHKVELSYFCGNLDFLQQKQNTAVSHACCCWHNRHCLFSPSAGYCKMMVQYFSICEGKRILCLLYQCLTIK